MKKRARGGDDSDTGPCSYYRPTAVCPTCGQITADEKCLKPGMRIPRTKLFVCEEHEAPWREEMFRLFGRRALKYGAHSVYEHDDYQQQEAART